MSLRAKLLAIVGIVFFLVLAGTATANALWSTPASISSTVRAANLADACTNVTSMVNASFEEPAYGDSSINYPAFGAMPGWRSYNAAGASVRSEVWSNGALGVSTPVGRQFLELNADVPGTLRQTLSTTPGQTLQWSFLHRGRAGVDTVELRIGAVGAGVSQGQFSDGTAGWVRYSGAYVVPAGQTTTELSFIAISTATGDPSVGNFLDDVSFGSGPCLTASSTATDVTTGNSGYNVGDTVEYTTTVSNIGSATALSSAFAWTLPAGLELVPGSITIDGVAKTDAASDDTADYTAASRSITARLGAAASATAGGTVAQGTSAVVRYRAVIQTSAAGTSVAYTPSVSYVNGLAPSWPLSVVAANAPITVQNYADVAVSVLSTPTGLAAGGTGSWSFSVTNSGTTSSLNLPVTITLPSQLTGVVVQRSDTAAATTATVNCTGTGTTRTCTFGTAIAPGTGRIITVTGTVPTTTVAATLSVVATAAPVTFDPVSSNNSATATTTISDITPPTVPTNVALSSVTETSIRVAWTASTDTQSGVASYRVFRNGVQVGTTTTNSFTSTGLTAGTPYKFTVAAVDGAGNVSAQSVAATGVTAFGSNVFRVRYASNLCMDGNPAVTPIPLIIDTCSPDATSMAAYTERWQMIASGPGFRVANSSFTQYNWDLASGTAVGDGTKVRVSTEISSRAQWTVVADFSGDTGYLNFVNVASGKCLDVNGQGTTPGTQLQIYTCNQTAAQRFTLEKIG